MFTKARSASSQVRAEAGEVDGLWSEALGPVVAQASGHVCGVAACQFWVGRQE